MLCLHAVTDENGHPLENEDESGRRLCKYWSTIFQARVEGQRHHHYVNILRYVQEAPHDIRWEIDRNEFDELMAVENESAQRISYSLYRCAGGLGSQFLFNAYKHVLEGGTIPELFAESRTVFIPKSSDVDNNGRIVRSPKALRPLTLCNCDCKILTTAICRALHWYTVRCIHPSQRCISASQMTDNIFEIETTALAHVACAPQESGILFTDFAAAYPHDQSFLDLPCIGKTALLEFICRFLRRIYYDSTTRVDFAGMTRGQFLMARGVRQGCPASGFLFAMAFDPIFRWLQDASLDFLHPAQCTYADDLAVAALSFRGSMTALAPALHTVDQIAGLILNRRKCC